MAQFSDPATNPVSSWSSSICLHVISVLKRSGPNSGTEENNESCDSIPGPACPAGSGTVQSGNGEGYVHIHRGFFGIGGTLSQQGYDWKNPVIQIEVRRSADNATSANAQ